LGSLDRAGSLDRKGSLNRDNEDLLITINLVGEYSSSVIYHDRPKFRPEGGSLWDVRGARGWSKADLYGYAIIIS
jgi:hypothetical protein